MKIETPRLVLRDFCPEDWQDLQQILGDQQTMAFCEPPYSPVQTKEFLQQFCIRQGNAKAAALKQGGKVIGYLLLKPLDRRRETWEIGWFFNRRFWRQGYAYEAASRLVAYAFETLGARQLLAETADPVKSARLMQKLGMLFSESTPVTLPDGSPAQLLTYRLPRQSWQN